MGRIKSTMMRKAARELVDTTEEFTEDFENNKKLLKGTIPYKSVRNKVAGAIVVLKKRKKQKPLSLKVAAEE
jgi:ribosomal protein S17E